MPISRLMQDGEFLTLSRQSPALFDTPLSFALTNQTQVKVYAKGIIGFEPLVHADKDIVLSCGVHGNETAPIELCDALVKDVLTEEIVLTERLLVQFANLPSMDIAKRFVEENMNRLFSGAHSEQDAPHNEERRRAKELESCVASFFVKAGAGRKRYHYDLHTAIRDSKNEKFAVYPYLHGKAYDKQQLEFLLACGINTILLSDAPTTTYSYYSSNEFGAHAFTLELGKVRPFGENDMSRFTAIDIALRKLVTGQTVNTQPYNAKDFYIYKVNQTIVKQQDDFALSFDDEVANFTDFNQGELLAQESGKEYKAQVDGEAIVFPNANVALGQRAILTVVPITL